MYKIPKLLQRITLRITFRITPGLHPDYTGLHGLQESVASLTKHCYTSVDLLKALEWEFQQLDYSRITADYTGYRNVWRRWHKTKIRELLPAHLHMVRLTEQSLQQLP